MVETDVSQVPGLLSVLEETVGRFQSLLDGLDESVLKKKPSPKEWSAKDILAHLHSCQEVWGYSVLAMLILDSPVLAHIHPRAWTKRLRYRKGSFSDLFVEYASKRKTLLRILAALDEKEWGKTGTIKRRTHSVYSQIRRMALHEEGHWPQLEAFLE